MKKHKSIKDQLMETTQQSRKETEERMSKSDLNQRINKAESIVKGENYTKLPVNEKVIRDAFTLHHSDIEKIKEIRKKCLRNGIDINKSFIVRAGIELLSRLSTDEINHIKEKLPKVKVGRPKSFK